MDKPFELPGINNITISGRIASGSTTLAKGLAQTLNWKHLEGGDIFWEQVREKLDLESKDTNMRPDQEDEKFDAELKRKLKEARNLIIETKLGGFNAQGISGVFKILVVCEDETGQDHMDIRIDRFVNREESSIQQAKEEVIERELNDLEKWRRMYAKDDPNWVYWDPKYYDLVVNTFSHNTDETLHLVLSALGFKKK